MMHDGTKPTRPPERPTAAGHPQTCGLAVASLIVSILGISLPGLILGILALRKINRSHGQLLGRGLAIAGIVISLIGLAACILVLLLLSFSFLGGWAVWGMMQPTRIENPVAAYYGRQEEIRVRDLFQAQIDLKLLSALGVERTAGATDLNTRLLMQVLYGTPDTAAYLENQIRKAAGQGYLDLTPSEIGAFFRDPRQEAALYWILLVAEAKAAGCTVSQEQAETFLKQVLSLSYPQEANPAQIIDPLATKYRIPNQRVTQTFADLLMILRYANQAAAGEILTAEYVQFDAMKPAKEQPNPTEEEIARQFETYKESAAGQIRPDNPYGFGYLLPKRAELEYILVEYADILKQVEKPVIEELEFYYTRNRDQFEESVLSDPNNPNSQTISRIRPFSEVYSQVRNIVLDEKVNRTAVLMLWEIRNMAPAELAAATGTDGFQQMAESLSAKYNIRLSTGRTGMADREGLLGNEQVGNLFFKDSYGRRIPIDEWVFSVPPEETDLSGGTERRDKIEPLTSNSKMAVVRVDSVRLPQAASLEQLRSAELSNVREQVIRDCKLLNAMEDAKNHAAKFAQEVIENGWQKTIEDYNLQSENKVSLTTVSKRRILLRPPQAEIVPAIQPSRTDLQQELLRTQDRELADSFYAMIPTGQTQAADTVHLLCLEICRSCYVIRNVSRKTGTMEDYTQRDADEAFQLEISGVNGFGVIHFRPQNILKRMKYRTVPVESNEIPAGKKPLRLS